MGLLTGSVLVGVMGVLTDNTFAEKMDLADKVCAKLCPQYRFFYDFEHGYLVFSEDSNWVTTAVKEGWAKTVSRKNFTEMTHEQIEEFVLTSSLEHTFS